MAEPQLGLGVQSLSWPGEKQLRTRIRIDSLALG